MILSLFLLSSLVLQPLNSAEITEVENFELQALDLETLDQSILQKRLKDTYGEFGRADKSSWDVSVKGQTEVWEWDGEKWTCPQPELFNCADWTPKAFEWWLKKGAWLSKFVNYRRQGFVLENDKVATLERPKSVVSSIFRPEDETQIEDVEPEEVVESFDDDEVDAFDPVRIGGRRLALETWQVATSSGESLKIYLSLRSHHWLERISYGNSNEYVEWHKQNRWSRPEVKSLIWDRGGVRVSFQRRAPSKKK